MESQQIVDYIAGQLEAGHSESDLRSHMVNHGWSEEAVNDAFGRYHDQASKTEPETAPEPKQDGSDLKLEPKAPRRGGRDGLRRKSKGVRAVVIAVILLLIVGGAFILFRHHTEKPAPPVVREPTFQQKQSLDVVTLGGAVGQYVSITSKTLPTKVSPAPDGTNSVVLCGATCDPSTWQVSSLSAYKPANVKMVQYTPGLKTPDNTVLYLVAGARCNKQGTELSTENVKPLSMSILYASKETTSLKQHCVIL